MSFHVEIAKMAHSTSWRSSKHSTVFHHLGNFVDQRFEVFSSNNAGTVLI